jgi:hypothetical protein
VNTFRIEEDLLGFREVPILLNEIELHKIFSPENLIRPEFRGKVFAPDAGSGTLPQSVTR